MNKYKFLFVNLGLGSLLLLGGLYLVGIGLLVGISAALEGVGFPKYFFLASGCVAFGCGVAALRVMTPAVFESFCFLLRNGLPKG